MFQAFCLTVQIPRGVQHSRYWVSGGGGWERSKRNTVEIQSQVKRRNGVISYPWWKEKRFKEEIPCPVVQHTCV